MHEHGPTPPPPMQHSKPSSLRKAPRTTPTTRDTHGGRSGPSGSGAGTSRPGHRGQTPAGHLQVTGSHADPAWPSPSPGHGPAAAHGCSKAQGTHSPDSHGPARRPRAAAEADPGPDPARGQRRRQNGQRGTGSRRRPPRNGAETRVGSYLPHRGHGGGGAAVPRSPRDFPPSPERAGRAAAPSPGSRGVTGTDSRPPPGARPRRPPAPPAPPAPGARPRPLPAAAPRAPPLKGRAE